MNRVILIGNLTRDPEVTTTAGGSTVCKFSLAVQRRFTNADGEREADFLQIVAWNKAAENCGKYLRKGSKAGVVGSIQTRSYDAQDGTKRYVTEVIAEEVEFLTSKSNAEEIEPEKQSTSKPPVKKKQVVELTPIDDDLLPF